MIHLFKELVDLPDLSLPQTFYRLLWVEQVYMLTIMQVHRYRIVLIKISFKQA